MPGSPTWGRENISHVNNYKLVEEVFRSEKVKILAKAFYMLLNLTKK
jgi:hypothetical protein